MYEHYSQTQYLMGIYILLLTIATSIFFSDQSRQSESRHGGTFTLMCFGVIGWISCEMARLFLVSHPTADMLVGNAILVFACLSISSQFLFSYWFFRDDYKIPVYVTLSFLIFPLAFALVALSPLYFIVLEIYSMMREGSDISMPYVDFTASGWELWLLASVVYSYVMIAAAALVVLQSHFRMARFYRLPSTMMIAAIIITFAAKIISLLAIPTILDPAIIAACVSLLLYRLAISTHDHSFYVRYARLQAFDFLKNLVIIVGKNGQIADFNYSANRWFSSIGIDLRKFTLESVLVKLIKSGAKVTPAPGVDDGDDISYRHNEFPIVLNMRIFNMIDKVNRKHGSIVFFFDVTQNRELFYKLEKKAGVDALSGLPNRMAYEGARARYDSRAHLPLSIVICDLNGLKTTNDNLGHKYGDLLIQTASRILENACQKPHFVGRIGGDEFVILLSQTNEQQAEVMINNIKYTMYETSNTLTFKVSMAMGAATKYSESESMEEIIALADSRMYSDKKAMKGEAPR
ncbi:MAG: diguanylate cyclase [Defluviitaleaceae bacterium]|nr:diguanylate cyclase [Defluviitaleaceae bacterium]